ncbi:Formate dehydrogenase, delta subunit [Candidatus Methylobacter favarea]|uniref:Formate dehydrogenase, delta subunit n=1 Tax=Candidatus Methylobacter favarea TaxID=2707345 RepID=A0A8S0WR69_9GAMM|nr:formate dehydrogenase subunit delta [Candidatus Methylobacter favarea]CAA9891859.1 Formate dehydrogenase, delta subunit [Candidatus Methylobacter favarea]
MKIQRLIKMANDISDFFNAESDKELAAEGVKKHILRSWDPRMRKDIIAYFQQDGAALSALAKAALAKLNTNNID